jgi:hypothetical protein
MSFEFIGSIRICETRERASEGSLQTGAASFAVAAIIQNPTSPARRSSIAIADFVAASHLPWRQLR